jgi:methyl-accepting chemotaxis protein
MAAGSEQAAASSEELSAQAEEMILIVADLARMVYGNHKGVPRATESSVSCWEVKNCPPDRRDSCPAYPSHGSQCWTVTGTLCGGQKQGSYQMKMDNCRKCDVYKLVKGDGNPRRLPVVKGSPKEHP